MAVRDAAQQEGAPHRAGRSRSGGLALFGVLAECSTGAGRRVSAVTEQEFHEHERTVPPPQGFDPLTAAQHELVHHRLPARPDAHLQPGLAALWDRQARRYRAFDHLETTVPRASAVPDAFGLEPTETCGYELTSLGQPFTSIFVTFTVPDLQFVASPQHGSPDFFHIFVGLGFIDVHVEMTVDAAQDVSTNVTVQGAPAGLPVRPGDAVSASLCLDTKPPGHATIVLANETTKQTVNSGFDSNFPPAVTVNAGVSRGHLNDPFNPLAQFGVVYFDEISTYTTGGFQSLTNNGTAVTLVSSTGAVLARPQRLNDFAFKVLHV